MEWQAALVGLAGVVAWGILLAGDYLLWDTIQTAHSLRNPAFWQFEVRLFQDTGMPFYATLLHLMRFFSVPELASKWVSVALWIVSAVFFRAFLIRGLDLSRGPSTWAACLAVTLPFYDMLGELSLLPYCILVSAFWLGWLVFLEVQWSFSARNLLTRSAALLLFCLSFQLGSNLPYFYAVLAVLLLQTARRPSDLSLMRAGLHVLLRHADFLVLPPLYWVCRAKLTPAQGWFYKMIDYNVPKLDVARILEGYASFLGMLRVELTEAFTPLWRPVIAGGIAVAIWAAIKKIPNAQTEELNRKRWLHVTALACFLTLSAAFAYVSVAKPIAAHGWNSRNGILLNFPVALGLVGAVCFLQTFLPRGGFYSRTLILGFLTAAAAVSANLSSLQLQGLWAKHLSAVPKIREAVSASGAVAVSLRDHLSTEAIMEKYPVVVWTYLIADPSHAPATLAVDTLPLIPDQTRDNSLGHRQQSVPLVHLDAPTINRLIQMTSVDYALTEIPRTGKTVTCVLREQTPEIESWITGWKYINIKYFRPNEVPAFLGGLTRVTSYTESGQPREH